MVENMSEKIKKLSKSEQKILFEKLDIYENLMHFWHVVEETVDSYKTLSAKRALEEWLSFLDVEHGSLRGFSKWQRIRLLDIMAFKEYLFEQNAKGEKRCESTVWQRLQNIKRINDRLFNFGLVPANAFITFKIKTKIHRPYKAPVLNEEQLAKLLSSNNLTTKDGRRNFAIFGILIGAGLRIGELDKLRCMDISQTPRGRVYMKLEKTKNQNSYLQPLPKDIGQNVYRYKIEIEEEFGTDASLFMKKFKNGSTRKLSYAGIRKLIQRRFQELNIPFSTTHSFRVTAITKLLQEKIPIQEVRKFARHESILTTDLYNRDTNVIDEETLNILDINSNPK